MIITNLEQLKEFIGIPGVYKFRFLTNFDKIYNGEANDLYDRLVRQYPAEINQLLKKKRKRPVIKAIYKYGWENIEIELINWGDDFKDVLTRQALETACIIEYNSLIRNEDGTDGNGYNVCLVSHNTSGMKHTEESKKKMSESSTKPFLGKHHSKESKEKLSKNNSRFWLGKKRSSETCTKMSENNARAMLGKKMPEETKNLISLNNPKFWLNKKRSKETKQKISETKIRNETCKGEKNPFFGQHHTVDSKNKIKLANSKQVKQIDKNTGETIKVWDSMTEAALSFNAKSPTVICDVANKRIRKDGYSSKTAYGFKWEYVEENQISQEISKNP